MTSTNQSRPAIGVEGNTTIKYEIVFGHQKYNRQRGEGAVHILREYFETGIPTFAVVPKFDREQLGSGTLFVTLPDVPNIDVYVAEAYRSLKEKMEKKGIEIMSFERAV